jgi:hypothetical protein
MGMNWPVVIDGMAAAATVGAAFTALGIAVREGRRYTRERQDQEAAQARLVMVSGSHGGGLWIHIVNHSLLPLIHIELIHVRDEGGPPDESWRVPPTISTQSERTNFGPGEELKIPVEFVSPAGEKRRDIRGGIEAIVRIMDANGLEWERTGNAPPKRVIRER